MEKDRTADMFGDLRQELELRIGKLRRGMEKEEADALLVSANVNLYYLSGRVFNGFVYLPLEGEPVYFVRRPVGLSGKRVVYIRKPEDMGDYIRRSGMGMPRTLMLEYDTLTHGEYLRYSAIFPGTATINGTPLLGAPAASKPLTRSAFCAGRGNSTPKYTA